MEERERARLDTEWTLATALRELIYVARRGSIDATYRQAITMGEVFAPEIFDPYKRILERPRETDQARFLRESAEAHRRLTSTDISDLDYVDMQIDALKDQIEVNPDAGLLQKKLDQVIAARQEMTPKKFSEHKIVFGDVFLIDRDLPVSGSGNDYIQYRLDDERGLRIRLFHPDFPESKLGADLLYEHLDTKRKMARVALVQYKVWDGKSLHRDARMMEQYEKMRTFACKNRLCDPQPDERRCFRLPTCTAFIRPTDALRDPGSKLASSGFHIPLCVADDNWKRNQRQGMSIRKSDIEDRALSMKVFEDLFNCRMAGSKEVPFSMLEGLYKSCGIFEMDETVLIHAQEVLL